MKLPRGTFHSIKKGILLHVLLDELEKNRFTGYCVISWGIETCTLVLDSGIIILADYNTLEGELAWQKMQNLLDTKVGADLTTLNPIQLTLTREFNPHATLPGVIRMAPATHVRTLISSPVTEKHKDISGNGVPAAHFEHNNPPGHPPVLETTVSGTHPVQETGSCVIPEFQQGQPFTQNESKDDGSDIDRDLASLDTMDIDEMTKKIRHDCKITIEHLDLDHLLEKDEDLK